MLQITPIQEFPFIVIMLQQCITIWDVMCVLIMGQDVETCLYIIMLLSHENNCS